nr:tripartite tricarboxylate transporter TctB family protein [Halomonas socia]
MSKVVRQMRLWFSLFLFIASVAYFIYGLNTLTFVSRIGRPGPGYFPGIVGVLLILFTALNVIKDLKAVKNNEIQPFRVMAMLLDRKASGPGSGDDRSYPIDVVMVILCIALLIGSITLLGGLLSMVVFMFVLLFAMNKRKLLVNVGYSIALPVALYLLFDVLLNASLPRGVLGI